jgi:hypothetical protein
MNMCTKRLNKVAVQESEFRIEAVVGAFTVKYHHKKDLSSGLNNN